LRQRDGEWFSSAKQVVLRGYRGKYVAVKSKRILAASSTMKGLYAKLDKLNPGMVLITRLEMPTLQSIFLSQPSSYLVAWVLAGRDRKDLIVGETLVLWDE